jgi:predicted  nucleic acid-binding Zn-ribbon protein
MAQLLNILERYRRSIGELRNLYEESNHLLEGKTELCMSLTRDFMNERGLLQGLLHESYSRAEVDSQELVKLRSALDVAKSTIDECCTIENTLLEAKAAFVEEKSRSLKLKGELQAERIKQVHLTEEFDTKQKTYEETYKLKLNVLLESIRNLEESRDRSEIVDRENVNLISNVSLLEARVKDLNSELLEITKDREEERRELNREISNLSKSCIQRETRDILLTQEIQCLRNMNEVLEAKLRSQMQSESNMKHFVEEIQRNVKDARMLDKQLAVSMEENERLKNDFALSRDTIVSLKQELANSNEISAKQQSSIEKLKRRNEALKQQRTKLVELFREKLRKRQP